MSKSVKTTILDRLAKGETLLGDGATGTFLQSHGLEPGGSPEELNLSDPKLVRMMAGEYFEAGSDFVLTNSFGGSRFMMEKYGHGGRVSEFNRLAAEHARSQAPEGRYVIGSVGPTGEFVEPLGTVSVEEMLESFAEQILALEAGGVDAILVETMTAIEEASLAIRAAKENTDLTVMATMTFDKGPRGLFTMMGITPERAAKELREAGADVVGANCGNGIEVMTEIAREIRAATDGYTVVNSNAGIPTIRKGLIVYPETPAWMAECYRVLADIGINVMGGCCGTTPAHTKAMIEAVRG
jgi:5-methyltetrahydrofolate--homocysteine methyltransferase